MSPLPRICIQAYSEQTTSRALHSNALTSGVRPKGHPPSPDSSSICIYRCPLFVPTSPACPSSLMLCLPAVGKAGRAASSCRCISAACMAEMQRVHKHQQHSLCLPCSLSLSVRIYISLSRLLLSGDFYFKVSNHRSSPCSLFLILGLGGNPRCLASRTSWLYIACD